MGNQMHFVGVYIASITPYFDSNTKQSTHIMRATVLVLLISFDLCLSYTSVTKSPYYTNNYVKPSKYEIAWQNRLHELISFKEEYGTCHVPYGINPKLSTWVSSQRHNYKQNKDGKTTSLNSERIEQLNEIGFVWEARETSRNTFEKKLDELRNFKNIHGHCNVPLEENPVLARWIQQQIKCYSKFKKGKKTNMTEEHAKELKSLGIEFEKQDSWTKKLKQVYELQLTYGQNFDMVNLPTLDDKTKQLRNWICDQRAQYKLYQEGKKSTLTPERIKALNDVQFDWGERSTPWSSRFEELRQYKLLHGDCLVPQLYEENPQLGTWVKAQRRHGKLFQIGKGGSSMTFDRYKKLDEIGFVWDLHGRSARKLSMEQKLSDRL